MGLRKRGIQGEACGADGGEVGEHHSGKLRHESAEAEGERIIAEELKRFRWKGAELKEFRKTHPEKLAMAVRLKRATTLTIREIAQRLNIGSWKSLDNRLYLASKRKAREARSKIITK
jgi:hypothetical protein